jgi:hypothetical protein
MNSGADVFISHSSHDRELGESLCSFLEERNIRCWIAPRDINPNAGKDYAQSIIDGIQSCKLMVVIFNKYANESLFVKKELERALHYKLTILPFKTDNTTPTKSLELYLSTIHWLDATKGKAENYFDELYKNCCSLLPDLPPPPPPPPSRYNVKRTALYIMVLSLVVIIFLIWKVSQPDTAKLAEKRKQEEKSEIIRNLFTANEYGSDYYTGFKFVPSISVLSDTARYSDYFKRVEQGSEVYWNYLWLSYPAKKKFSNIRHFYIKPYTVNSLDWEAVTGGKAPKRVRRCNECPLEPVAWELVQGFLDKLNEKTGMAFRVPKSMEEAYANSLGLLKQVVTDSDGFINRKQGISDLGFWLCSDTEMNVSSTVIEEKKMYSVDTLFSRYGHNDVVYPPDTFKLKRDIPDGIPRVKRHVKELWE